MKSIQPLISWRAGTALALIASLTGLHASLPTNNPIAEFYGADAYPWTDDLPWDRVFDFTTFEGADNHERFEAAQDAIQAAGGGVLYFPAGTFEFTDDLFLRDGVILRGATPAQTDAKQLDFDPPSKLVFPKYNFVAEGSGTPNDTAFKFIREAPGNIGRDLGYVYLEVNRAGVRASGGHPDSRRNVVFGVRSNNVAEASAQVPIDGMHEWQRHSWRFTRNIHVYAYRYALVANNRVNDKHWLQHRRADGSDTFGIDLDDPAWEIDDFEQPGYLVREQNSQWANPPRELTGSQAVFNYTDNYGIVMRGGSGSVWGAAPHENPAVFRRDKELRDNWVYGTMRVKMHTSGYGLVIRDNVLRDREGKVQWLHATGRNLVNPANTLENRGIDWSGREVVIEGNDVEVHRHKMRDTHYLSVDGEAILYQECCGGSIIDGITIRNNSVNAYIGLYKGPYLRNALIEGNTVFRGPTADVGLGIYVVSDTNNRFAPLYNVVVRNNTLIDMPLLVRGNLRPVGQPHTSRVYNNVVDGRSVTVMDYVDAFDNTRPNGDPIDPDILTSAFDIPFAPEVDARISGHPDDVRAGEAVKLHASVVNDTPVDRVVFYDGTTAIAEFNDPPFVDLEWTGAASSDDPLYTAVAYQPAVQVDHNFVQFTSAFFGWMEEEPDEAITAWLEAYFAPEEREDPDLLLYDFNGNGQPALLDFLVGRNPKAAHPPVQPEIIRDGNEDVRVRFRFRPTPQVAAVLEASSDLQTWSPLLHSSEWTLTPEGDDWILEAEASPEVDAPSIIRLRATRR